MASGRQAAALPRFGGRARSQRVPLRRRHGVRVRAADELARRSLATVVNDDQPPLVNVGCGEDLTIRELAELVRRVVGVDVAIEWDSTSSTVHRESFSMSASYPHWVGGRVSVSKTGFSGRTDNSAMPVRLRTGQTNPNVDSDSYHATIGSRAGHFPQNRSVVFGFEDETTIVGSARQQPAQIVALFSHGTGRHEHPPLSDILLHYWLEVASGAQWSLRLPSSRPVPCRSAGPGRLGASAGRRCGLPRNAMARSPLAIWCRFGRLIGWYSFCFLMVAALTFSYLPFVAKPGWARLAAIV